MDHRVLARHVALALATLLLAYAAFANALGGVVKASHPAVALDFDAHQPTALTVLADETLLQTDNPAAPKLAAEQAHKALRSLALSPAALRILGLVDADKAGADRARALMDVSTRVSRHDFGAQLWWIEHQVAQGNAVKALEHYDIAMRTSQSARRLLIPVLAGALDDPEIQRDIVPYVRVGSPWVPELIAYESVPGRDPSNLVNPILRAGQFVRSTEFQRLASQMMETLLAAGNVEGIQKIYLALPGADAELLRTADFNNAATQEKFVPVAWDLSATSTAGSALEKGEGGAATGIALRAFAGPGERGVVARKLLFLKPGQYGFSTSTEIVSRSAQQIARWQVACIVKGNRQIIWQAEAVAEAKSPTNRDMVVPDGCPAQYLELELQAGDEGAGLEFLVHAVRFLRRGG